MEDINNFSVAASMVKKKNQNKQNKQNITKISSFSYSLLGLHIYKYCLGR